MMTDVPPQTPSSAETPEPILRPEARVVRADRSLAAMVLLVCTLGGMGIGFGSAMYLMRVQWAGGAPVAVVDSSPDMVTWLGVGVRSFSGHEGALVLRVFDGTSAERAGMAAGDIVTTFAGEAIRGSEDLVNAVRAHAPGDIVDVGVQRHGQPQTLRARLGFR
jgi:PDZ domain-containing protein